MPTNDLNFMQQKGETSSYIISESLKTFHLSMNSPQQNQLLTNQELKADTDWCTQGVVCKTGIPPTVT